MDARKTDKMWSQKLTYVIGEQKAVHQVQHNTIIVQDKAFFF